MSDEPRPGDSLIGRVIDERYRVHERLGAGGMGAVYRAERVNVGRVVAIKVLLHDLADQPGFLKRFEREALALGRLYHIHCVSLVDVGVADGMPYLVMDYVPGKTLSSLLRRGPLAPERAVAITLQLLDALAYLHARNVIHRDLKAANIMLVDGDEGDFVKLLDFGMAKLMAGVGADIVVSARGMVAGTPSAMSPEQIREQPLDGRSDLYAVGVLLYAMLVGRPPFWHADMVEIMKMHLERDPVPPREIAGASAISAELEQCVLRALAKDRAERFADAGEMADALAATPEGATRRRATTTTTADAAAGAAPPPRTRDRLAMAGWYAFAALAAVILVSAMVSGAAPWSSRAAPTAPPEPAPERPMPTRPAAASAVDAAPPAATAPIDAGAPLAPPDAAAPAVDAPWAARRDEGLAHAAAGRHRLALRAVREIVRDHPEAKSDPGVVRAAIDALALPRGHEYAEILARVFADSEVATDAFLAAIPGGESWYVRHHALMVATEMGQRDRADLVGLWQADLEGATSCQLVRQSHAKLAGSDDPRAAAALERVRAIAAAEPDGLVARCLPP